MLTGNAMDSFLAPAEVGRYLARIGYCTEDGTGAETFRELRVPLKRFQRFLGLEEQGGEFGPETRSKVEEPRCMVRDPSPISSWRRRIRGPNAGGKDDDGVSCPWPKSPKFELAYGFEDVAPDELKAAVRAAMRAWEGEADAVATFREVSADGEVLIGWTGPLLGGRFDPEHDLTGNFIAHAHFPCQMNIVPKRIHFDTDHFWAPGRDPSSFNAQVVAMHELGHILGLSHSGVKEDIMYPYFSENQDIKTIKANDMKRLVKLYKDGFLKRLLAKFR